MAPADNTPDFDSMTPEEIMAWMETLAKRQGVKSEELTTSADVDIPEIDPSTVVIDEPGYVPYGEERPPKPSAPPARSEPPIAAQPPRPSAPPASTPPVTPSRTFSAPPPRPHAADEPQTPARPISPLTSRPTPQPPSGMNPLRPPSVPPNRPMPTPPSTPARSAPDFPARDVSRPPSPNPAAGQPPSQSAPPPRTTSQPPAPNTPPPRPASQPPTPSVPPIQQNPRTAFEPPKWLTSRPTPSTPSTPAKPPTPPTPSWAAPEPPKETPRAQDSGAISGDTDAMAWLESLAADQGDSLFNLDLSALIGESESEPEPAAPVDTVSWLQNLTQTQGEDDSTDIFERPQSKNDVKPPVVEAPKPANDIPTVSDPFDAGVDPVAWLENLARRQGAKSEELTTSVSMDIPVPENPVIDEPGYKPFSFDAPIERHKPPTPSEQTPFTLEDPASWLGSLADAEGFDEDILGPLSTPALSGDEDVDIERAISEGTVSPEQMQTYLEHQTDRYVEELGSEQEAVDEDAPPVPADLPDWLLEQVGAPPTDLPSMPVAESAVEQPLLDEMPDWLLEESGSLDASNIINIFDDDVDAEDSESILAEPAFAGYKLEIDRSDPWVEAFEEEQEEGLPDITELPDWYVDNLSNPERVAAVEQLAGEPAPAEAALPEETELPAGEPVDVPAWAMQGSPAVEAAVSDIPDWLREIETTVEPEDIPDWLTESMDETAETFDDMPPARPAPVEPEPPVAPEPVVTLPPVQPKPEPTFAQAPVQQPAASADLETARTHAQSGNLDSSVASYEALIRANRELDQVVEDLTGLSKTHRGNPAVYRVLGDGLMRQGKLQAALDIYREALNQL